MLQVDEIPDLNVNFVRDVAPKKEMFRVTFPLQLEFVLKKSDVQEPCEKKQKINENNG